MKFLQLELIYGYQHDFCFFSGRSNQQSSIAGPKILQIVVLKIEKIAFAFIATPVSRRNQKNLIRVQKILYKQNIANEYFKFTKHLTSPDLRLACILYKSLATR